MQYDNIKRTLGVVFNHHPALRKCFYMLLDLLLLRAWHIKKELRRLAKTLPDDAYIFDAGAGFGQYAYFMAHLNKKWNIKAVDIKEEQVEDCNRFFEKNRQNHRVHFERADLTAFCEPEKYHIALAIDVMEHIQDDVSVFRNIFCSLKQGGVLLMSTPSDKGGSDTDHDRNTFIDEHVRNGYNPEELRKKLANAGFSEIKIAYTYGRLGNISWLLSMKYPMLALGASKLFFILLPFYYIIVFPLCLLLNWWDISVRHSSGTGLKISGVKLQS